MAEDLLVLLTGARPDADVVVRSRQLVLDLTPFLVKVRDSIVHRLVLIVGGRQLPQVGGSVPDVLVTVLDVLGLTLDALDRIHDLPNAVGRLRL